MPSVCRVVEQKFYSQYNNGVSFTDNKLTDFATHLKGGVLETLQADISVEVDWYFHLLGDYIIAYDLSASTLRLSQDGMNLIANGFSIGDEIKISIDDDVVGKTKIECDITSISEAEITCENVSITLDSGTGIVDGINKISASAADIITGLTTKTACEFKFGLIENDEPFNTLSKLTNTDQRYLVEGITGTLADGVGVPAGNNKAWVTNSFYSGELKIQSQGLVKDKDYIYNEDTTQKFRIVHEFSINPLFRDGEEDSLTGDDIPPTDIYNGDMSLRYVFQTEFRTVLNNPNTANVSKHSTGQGSVGYLDESLNAHTSDFEVNDITYTDSNGDVVDKLVVGEITTVTATVLSRNSIMQTDNPIMVGHTAIVDSNKYANSTKEYDEIWFNESLKTSTAAGSTVSGDIIKSIDVTYQDAHQIDFTFGVDLRSSEAIDSLEENQQYLLYYIIGDSSKTVDEGTKVTGRLDVNFYRKSNDVSGLLNVTRFQQYPSSYEFENGVTTGFQNVKGFNESGLMLDTEFEVAGSGEVIQDIAFEVVVFNTDDNSWSTLRKLPIDISDSVLMPKPYNLTSQQIELDSTRNYILKDTDQFNYLKMSTTNYDLGVITYQLQVGYKIPWQEWSEFKDAPLEFYNKTKSYNGLNQKASEYSNVASLGNFEIRCLLNMTLRQESSGIDTQYVVTSDKFDIYDYDTDDQDPDGFSAVINTFDKNGVALAANIIDKEYTELRATFTPAVPPTFSESVDMTEVSSEWGRFAHGNKNTSGTGSPREGVWANEQASDTDTFEAFTGVVHTKNDAGLYTSSSDEIKTTANCNAFYGCYSNQKYESYSISGEIFSDSTTDNDGIIYTISYHVDEEGVEHTLSLVCTTGGLFIEPAPLWSVGDETVNIFYLGNDSAKWALIYDLGKRDWKVLAEYDTGETGYNWGDSSVGDLFFNVNRSVDDIEVEVDWTIGGTQYTNTFNHNLNDDTDTLKFKGFNSIGFGFMSQAVGGFKNVNLAFPLSTYTGSLRIEPEGSTSDLGVSVLNTDVEAPNNSLLKEIDDGERKAFLSYDGTEFRLQGLIDTSQIQKGQNYRFSAELRARNLLQ